MKAALHKKKQAPSHSLIDDIARCYARAVADDLLAEYDRAVEAAANKPKRSGTSTRRRARATQQENKQ